MKLPLLSLAAALVLTAAPALADTAPAAKPPAPKAAKAKPGAKQVEGLRGPSMQTPPMRCRNMKTGHFAKCGGPNTEPVPVN